MYFIQIIVADKIFGIPQTAFIIIAIFSIFLLLLVLYLLYYSLIVPKDFVYVVINKKGNYRLLTKGFHLIVPFYEKLETKIIMVNNYKIVNVEINQKEFKLKLSYDVLNAENYYRSFQFFIEILNEIEGVVCKHLTTLDTHLIGEKINNLFKSRGVNYISNILVTFANEKNII